MGIQPLFVCEDSTLYGISCEEVLVCVNKSKEEGKIRACNNNASLKLRKT